LKILATGAVVEHQGEASRTLASRTYDWMRGSSKSQNCQGVIKKQYYSLQWTRKQYHKGWKPFSTKKITLQCKTHLQNKKTTS